jgi:CheY-like chemotaxis protein
MATPRALADPSSSSLLLSLIAQADDPMAIVSVPSVAGEDARLIAANPAFCRLVERSLEELIDLAWLTLCGRGADADAHQTLIDRVRRALYRREHLAVDLPLARVDSLDIVTHCELLPIRDARGVATAMLIVQRDITRQKQTREMLVSLRTMTRRASHEVNNELASVIINLSLASSTRVSDDDRREHIRDALKAARGAAETAKRLSALASDLEPPPQDDPSVRDAALANATATAATASGANSATARVAASEALPGSATAGDESEPEPAAVPRVGSLLILEDDEIVKTLLANYLGISGFEVAATCESDQCVALYRDAFNAGRPFDLVILDLRIGRAGMGGMETLLALQTIDPHVRAIAHSGYSTDDVMLNPTRFGFVASIKKPTAPSEIAHALSDLVRVHGS